MATVPRLQDVEVDDAELIQELQQFHQESRNAAQITTVEGETIRPGSAVVLTDQAYMQHGLSMGSPVYVHDVNLGARILWAAAFTKHGQKIMFFMAPEMVQKLHETSTPEKKKA